MTTRKTTSRPIRTLFSLGRVADWTDGELLEWFESRHAEAEAAFEELVARHGAMVLDVCRRVLRDPHDVEDAFQATFLVLLRQAGSVRNRDALGGWLHRVALRIALRARTEAAHRREIEQQVIAPATSDLSPDDIERAEIRAALHEELDRVPASNRAALIACYLEGLTHEEAAQRLQWPVGTVRSRLARGRDRLRARLARRGLAPGVVVPALASPPDAVPASLQKIVVHSLMSDIAGRSCAGKVPVSVEVLAKEVIKAMKLRTLRTFAAVALTAAAVAGMLPFLPIEVARQTRAFANKPQRAEPDPPGSFAGVVRDPEGNPVAGATVIAGAFRKLPKHLIATTGPDGRFRFPPKVDAGKLTYVVAYKEGLAPASKFHGISEKPEPSVDLHLVLVKSEPFVGTVRDRDGRPIVGAGVRIKYMRGKGGQYDYNPVLEHVLRDTSLESLFNTTSDVHGEFHFPAVPAPQGVVLNVTADGMGDLSTEVPDNFEAGYISGTVAEPARLTMESEARVVGHIVTKLPGVRVGGLMIGLQSTHNSPHFWRDTRTGAEGRFEMRGLPKGGANIFPIDHPSDGPWTYRAIDSLALHPGKTAEVTIELIEGVLVEGKVADAGTSDPIVGVSVGMYGPARPRSGAAILIAKTNDKGQYRFRLPPGSTNLYMYSADPWSPRGQDVMVPADSKTFTAPILILPRKPAVSAPNAPG